MNDIGIIKELVKEIFISLNGYNYVVVKFKGDLSFEYGSDVDLFVEDRNEISEIIINKISKSNLKFKVNKTYDQLYIDIINDKPSKQNIIFRFDLYNELPKFRNVSIKESFFYKILLSRIKVITDDVPVFIPNMAHEAALRYIEYIEWYAKRPDKIKHIEFIHKNLSPDDINEFLKLIHQNIQYERSDLPSYSYAGSLLRNLRYYIVMFRRALEIYNRFGINEFLKVVKRRIK